MTKVWTPASPVSLFLVSLLFLFLLISSAAAQSGRSTVRGTVKDPQGNIVAGATVTLSNEQKKLTRTLGSTSPSTCRGRDTGSHSAGKSITLPTRSGSTAIRSPT
jgi:hypothetical protein